MNRDTELYRLGRAYSRTLTALRRQVEDLQWELGCDGDCPEDLVRAAAGSIGRGGRRDAAGRLCDLGGRAGRPAGLSPRRARAMVRWSRRLQERTPRGRAHGGHWRTGHAGALRHGARAARVPPGLGAWSRPASRSPRPHGDHQGDKPPVLTLMKSGRSACALDLLNESGGYAARAGRGSGEARSWPAASPQG